MPNKPGRPLSTTEPQTAHQKYQRKYYQKHREKAKAYQRIYAKQHKKPTGRKQGGHPVMYEKREKVQLTFNSHHIMESHDTKLAKVLSLICSGQRGFTL